VIFEKNLNIPIQLINDENFVMKGKIIGVYNNAIAFFTDGKTIFLSFDRVKEIRPLGGHNDR